LLTLNGEDATIRALRTPNIRLVSACEPPGALEVFVDASGWPEDVLQEVMYGRLMRGDLNPT
jgi:hypothetical protein